MTGRSDADGDEPSEGSAAGRLLIAAVLVLAIAATAVLVLSDSAKWLRLGVLAALWAALLGVFLAARYRKQVRDREHAAADLQSVYELELEREVAARREYELEVDAEARRKVEESRRDDLAELRAELRALRENLDRLTGGEVLVERFALRAQSTRMRALPDAATRVVPMGGETHVREAPRSITAAPIQSPAAPTQAAPISSGPVAQTGTQRRPRVVDPATQVVDAGPPATATRREPQRAEPRGSAESQPLETQRPETQRSEPQRREARRPGQAQRPVDVRRRAEASAPTPQQQSSQQQFPQQQSSQQQSSQQRSAQQSAQQQQSARQPARQAQQPQRQQRPTAIHRPDTGWSAGQPAPRDQRDRHDPRDRLEPWDQGDQPDQQDQHDSRDQRDATVVAAPVDPPSRRPVARPRPEPTAQQLPVSAQRVHQQTVRQPPVRQPQPPPQPERQQAERQQPERQLPDRQLPEPSQPARQQPQRRQAQGRQPTARPSQEPRPAPAQPVRPAAVEPAAGATGGGRRRAEDRGADRDAPQLRSVPGIPPVEPDPARRHRAEDRRRDWQSYREWRQERVEPTAPEPDPEPSGTHTTGLSVTELLAAHANQEDPPRRHRRRDG